MDDRRFDQVARALGRASTRRGAIAALLGLGAAAGAARDAGARKKCRPKCPDAQRCERGACVCRNGGAVCGEACCLIGQRCQGGTCAVEPVPCIAAGERCKDTGRVCCDGTVCGSGQGGQDDIACYVPAGAACRTTADCVYFAACEGGVCVDRQPQPAPACTVCASGCPFSTIEAAIAAAPAGATVTVAPGTYAPAADEGKYLSVVRALTLKSCDPGGTVTVLCPGIESGSVCIATEANASLVLDGFSLEGSSTNSLQIGIYPFDKLLVSNVTINTFTAGIYASSPNADVTVGNGVSLTDLPIGLNKGNDATISCSAAPQYTSVSQRCLGGNFDGCRCNG